MTDLRDQIRDLNLTPKQLAFVEAYAGNATEAARIAGYKNPRFQGCENLTKPNIKKALEIMASQASKARIATREERQEFWTKVMKGQSDRKGEIIDMRCRLKASELLARSHADFIERHDVSVSGVNVTFVYPHRNEADECGN